MHIQLGDLSVGKWRPLTTKELTEMFAVLKKPQALGKIKKNETINKAKRERWGRT
jgi:hypothetical protein